MAYRNNEYNLKLDGFIGINNKNKTKSLKDNELVNVVNLDIDNTGKVSTRTGYTKLLNFNDAHSLFSDNDFIYMINNDDLIKIDKNLNKTIIDIDYKNLNTKFLKYNNNLIITNKNFIRKYINNKVYQFPKPIVNEYNHNLLNGNLKKGIYKIAICYVEEDTNIEYSTLDSYIVEIEEDNKSINLYNLPVTNIDTLKYYRLYISERNSEVLYHYDDFLIENTNNIIINEKLKYTTLKNQFLTNIKNGEDITILNSVIYTSLNNYLYFTDYYSFLTKNTNYILFEDNILNIASTINSIIIFTENSIYYLNDKLEKIINCKCVKNTLTYDDNNDIYIYSDRGQIKIEYLSNKINLLTENNFIPDLQEIGSAIYIKNNGIKKIINSFNTNTKSNNFTVNDYTDAEIIRRS